MVRTARFLQDKQVITDLSMHPIKNKWIDFESKIPNDFKQLLDLLKNLSS